MSLGSLLVNLTYVWLAMLAGRIVFSWIPVDPNGPFAALAGVCYRFTEPVLAPVRNVIPPMGGFDLSVMIVFFVVQALVIPLFAQLG